MTSMWDSTSPGTPGTPRSPFRPWWHTHKETDDWMNSSMMNWKQDWDYIWKKASTRGCYSIALKVAIYLLFCKFGTLSQSETALYIVCSTWLNNRQTKRYPFPCYSSNSWISSVSRDSLGGQKHKPRHKTCIPSKNFFPSPLLLNLKNMMF